MVEQYLAEDIAAGRVVTLAQKQAEANAVVAASMPVSEPPPVNSLPSFEATTMELKNPSSGLDLSLHGLVDPDTGAKINLHEFLDGSETAAANVGTNSDRIMQVDGMLATSSVIMQVDGADDEVEDEAIEDLEDDISEADSRSNTPTNRGRVPQIESRCPICEFFKTIIMHVFKKNDQ